MFKIAKILLIPSIISQCFQCGKNFGLKFSVILGIVCRSAVVGFSVLQTSRKSKTLICLDLDLSTCSDLLPCDSPYKQGNVAIYNQILDTDCHILDVDFF